MSAAILFKRLCATQQFLSCVFYRRLSQSTQKQSNIVFRSRSMYDYHEDETAMNNLLRCNDAKDPVYFSPVDGTTAPSNFYLEYTDSLYHMRPYLESYCQCLLDSTDGRVVAMNVINLKRVYFGAYVMTVGFERLMRVDMNRRRQGLATSLYRHNAKWYQSVTLDYTQNHTVIDNTISLSMQRSWADERKTCCHLDAYLIPTRSDPALSPLHKLTAEQTEHLCMVDMADWISRPVLPDLRRILEMKEYHGTFCVGDFRSGRYAAASVWQPSTGVICNDHPDERKAYRGPIYYVFNLFQPSNVTLDSNNEMQALLSAIRSKAATESVPFVLCYIEQSSPFNALCRQQALAMITLAMLQCAVSPRSKMVEDIFHNSPVWHDPRDLS